MEKVEMIKQPPFTPWCSCTVMLVLIIWSNTLVFPLGHFIVQSTDLECGLVSDSESDFCFGSTSAFLLPKCHEGGKNPAL